MTTALLAIDVQHDFVDSPEYKGSLAVTGAYEDTKRLISYIKANTPDAIFVTLDTHAVYDIAHSAWWVDQEGKNVPAFTLIKLEDILNGKYKAADPAEQKYSQWYASELERKGKYPLFVWPNHCIKGSKGHELVSEFALCLKEWEESTGKKVQYIYKGMNPRTEHYSGLRAEVELSDDPSTQLNVAVIKELDSYDNIVIVGQAQSHCVASTGMDVIENIKNPSKVVIMTDCMSSVTGFEKEGEAFLVAALEGGARVEKSQKPSLKM